MTDVGTESLSGFTQHTVILCSGSTELNSLSESRGRCPCGLGTSSLVALAVNKTSLSRVTASHGRTPSRPPRPRPHAAVDHIETTIGTWKLIKQSGRASRAIRGAKPGHRDLLLVTVLKPLPSRPATGEILVRQSESWRGGRSAA